MGRNYIPLFYLLIFLFSTAIYSQEKNLWAKVDDAKIKEFSLQKDININKYQNFELKIKDFKNKLKAAPGKEISLNNSTFKIQFPDKNGKTLSFWIKEAPVMHPDLAKKFPNNKSYIGKGIDDSSVTVRFSVDITGLHAMIITKDRKVQYIDPVQSSTKGDKKYYRSYSRSDLKFENKDFICLTKDFSTVKKSALAKKIVNDGKLRTYRLALAATGEYSLYHIDLAGANDETDIKKKEIVLASMTTAMTRVNAVFENDLAISMQLVANNTDIIYLDPATDPYTDDDGDAMLNQNQTTCDNIIGSSNYDIGHVFSTGGRGIASRASACTSSKAKGVTGSTNPIGDFFYYDFVAHEMGHQFGGNHNFNGDEGNCNGNRVDEVAVEPGSGSTLMAYAGLCSPQNVQAHSDLYFHVISIDEIWTNITAGNSTNCGVKTNLINNVNPPVANAGSNYTIPVSTAYKLTGQGSDADGDPITFCWEQMDIGLNSVPPKETDLIGPLYRSINPSTSNMRYLPSLKTLAKGNISSTWEVTPSVSRDLNFRLTVRDNNKEGGQTDTSDMVVTIVDTAGPFEITSQNSAGLIWQEGASETINWNVAGTDGNGINTSRVNILLSTDGGLTFPNILVSNTINDGTQNITVPNISSPKCFVLVEAVGNIYFSLNKIPFSIGEFTTECTNYISTDIPKNIPDNDLNGVVSTIDVADNEIISAVKVNIQSVHTWVEDLTLSLESPSGATVILVENQCPGPTNKNIDAIFDDDGEVLKCQFSSPVISGINQPTAPLSEFNGESSQGQWKLKIIDDAGDDTGTLEGWSLELCSSKEVVAVNRFALQNFIVYPNPSEGLFHVSFKPNSEQVEISLYDMLGRKIKKIKYINNSAIFTEEVDFTGVTKGIYLLYVKNKNNFSTKTIQIN